MKKPRYLDITGQRFGRLVAIKRRTIRDPSGHPYSYWVCQCDCGSKTEVRLASLRSGVTKSCGCLKADSLALGATNMLGKRIGSFIVVEKVPVKKGAIWLCRCECGHEFESKGRLLRNGQIRHCPECRQYRTKASRNNSFIGRKFGHLYILSVASTDHRGRIMECICECGGKTQVPLKYLRSGSTKSCGCLKARKLRGPMIRAVKKNRRATGCDVASISN